MEFPKAGSGPNRQQIIDALRNTAQSASNNIAETASMPVDALAWALRKMGVPVGDKPVMGSDWMRGKGLTAPTQEGASKVVGDTIGMISPMGFTKQGAQAMIDAGSKLKGLPVGNMFIGETAKTWDEVAAAQAKMLEGQGKSAQEIWKETGTFKGPDGKYRQEIADDMANFLPNAVKDLKNNPGKKQGQIFEHENLYGAYPDAKNIWTGKMLGENAGGYADGVMGKSDMLYLGMPKKGAFDLDELKRTNLHELQHAIQHKEGFAKGGAADEFTRFDFNALQAENQKYAQAMKDFVSQKKAEGVSFKDATADGYGKTLADSLTKLQDTISAYKNPEDAYRRLAGEAEARAVEARMNLNAKQRRELFPLDSYDVPVNKLIVK